MSVQPATLFATALLSTQGLVAHSCGSTPPPPPAPAPAVEVCDTTPLDFVTITDASGKVMKFGPGDTHFAVKGEQVTWKINSSKVRKCFFIYTGDQVEAAVAAE